MANFRAEMPSIISHPAVPLALAFGLGRQVVSERLLLAGVAASVLPDVDVVAFRFGIPYADDLGHRGFTHSLLFAAFVALATACAFRFLRTTFARAFWFVLVATASHGILDSLTNGGFGVAFFWPWSGERYFAPIRVIEVSPLSIQRFFSEGGGQVLLSELIWVWAPCAILAALLLTVRKTLALTTASRGRA